MLKQNLNQNQTRPVAKGTLVDNNGIPYENTHSHQMKGEVYGYEVVLNVEGRTYESLEGIKFLKLSYTAIGQLPNKEGIVVPNILPERYAIDIDSKTIENLVRLDLARVCSEVSWKDEAIACINLLGSHGAKLDKNGYPVLYIEDFLPIKDLAQASVGDVVAVRILYTISAMRVYINAYPQVKANKKIHAYPTTEDKNERLSLTEIPFNTVMFFSDVHNIRTEVENLVKSNTW
jgi:hypothetical protein